MNMNKRAALIFAQTDTASRCEAWRRFNAGESLAALAEEWENAQRGNIQEVLKRFNPAQEMERCAQLKIELIEAGSADYPDLLREIPDAPFILYARGKIEMLHDWSIAVVGSRQASFYGADQARRFTRALADAGFTIVSGLARGIDEAAHEAALDAEGRTVAVLGCGLDVIYPPENAPLFSRIAEEGLLISEYPLGAEPRAHHFPRRNRILSGLSLGVLVVEAHERSGSLITAYQALEQGREVFAIPGPVHNLTSRGTHRLIREGAALVEGPEEIVCTLAEHPGVLGYHAEKRQAAPAAVCTAPEPGIVSAEHPLEKILKNQACDYETLLEKSGMEAPDFARVLTELEIEGRIRKNRSGYFEAG